jgi:hypothetical protein
MSVHGDITHAIHQVVVRIAVSARCRAEMVCWTSWLGTKRCGGEASDVTYAYTRGVPDAGERDKERHLTLRETCSCIVKLELMAH